MTGREIAEWLGISYDSTYHKNPSKHIEKLGGYCEYQKVRGGVIISKIYTDVYYGDLAKQVNRDYVNEIKSKANRLSSVAGMTRKFQKNNEEYASMINTTLYYQLSKAGEICFGKTNQTSCKEHKGAYGWRTSVWAIKIDDYNNYRYFSLEEEKLFNEIINRYYGKDCEKVKQLAILDDAFKHDEISKEEYFSKKDEYNLDFFGQCIEVFKDKTGLIVARIQAHEFNQMESAF